MVADQWIVFAVLFVTLAAFIWNRLRFDVVAMLALLAVAGIVAALRMWPADDPVEVAHSHDHLPVDHPHLAGGHRHSHAFVIDDLHRVWPAR